MQILHPFAGSVQQYLEQLDNPDPYRPDHCPQCQAKHPLTAHGFYTRTIIDSAFDGFIRVRRYLCEACRRTVSLLPEFALPYLRSSVTVIALFLVARLLHGKTLKRSRSRRRSPYQRGQFWVRRFRAQAESLCAALAALTTSGPGAQLRRTVRSPCSNATGWIRRSSLPVRRPAPTPAGLAAVRSLPTAAASPSRPPPRPPEPPHTPFVWTLDRLSPYARTQEKTVTPWTTKPKKSPCSVTD